MATWRPNFSWITPDLAVGGSFPPERTALLATDHGIGAVVDLREEACDEAARLAAADIAFLHLPTPDHRGVSPAMLRDGVAFVNGHLDSGRRVLVHCEHGIGRSATLALCVLVSRGEAPLDALERAKSRRWLVSPSPDQFHAWIGWLDAHRASLAASWEPPSFDAFAAIAYRHLADG